MRNIIFGFQKKWILVGPLFCVGACKPAHDASLNFLPENNLWVADTQEDLSNVSEKQFEEVLFAADKIYFPIASKRGENIVINQLWNDPTVNANTKRNVDEAQVVINVFGGLARRPEITPDALALVVCHELGHAYGGEPYLFPNSQLAAEGMADYYGIRVCLPMVLRKIESSFDVAAVKGFVAEKCGGTHVVGAEEYAFCVRSLVAAQNLSNLLAALYAQPVPSFTTPDLSEVVETEVSYPRTVQCRLDTFLNGLFAQEKPRCWFKPR